MSYRQDLPGFGEPTEGWWDGFQRINTETKSGGIIVFFKQGSKEIQRLVTVQMLDPNVTYRILSVPEGKEIGKLTGKELGEKGFHVMLEKQYDDVVFEIVSSKR